MKQTIRDFVSGMTDDEVRLCLISTLSNVEECLNVVHDEDASFRDDGRCCPLVRQLFVELTDLRQLYNEAHGICNIVKDMNIILTRKLREGGYNE